MEEPKLNILISAGIFPPDIGGPANFVPRIAHWLTQRGHTVQVICWSDSLDQDDSCYSFKVRRISRGGLRSIRSIRTVFAIYKSGKYADLVFANGLNLESRIAATLLRKPELHKVVGDRAWEIARVRKWYADTIDHYQSAPKKMRLRLLDKLRNLSMARAHLIITPSRYLANIVSGWRANTKPPQVIYNSTSLKQFTGELTLPEFNGKTISTVCRLVPWKGVDRLIDSLCHLSDTRLVVAGDGPEREKLCQRANSLGVADRVVFLGQVSKQKVQALLNSSDIFVLNSGYEGLPHVVLEAMAAGVPVIATDVGGTAEVVKDGHTGLLIGYGDDQALVRAISALMDDHETCKRLTTNARRMLEEYFDEEKCFLAYENALVSLKSLNAGAARVAQDAHSAELQ